MRLKSCRPLAIAAAALTLGACVGDSDELTTIPAGAGTQLFARYVSLGNSITAGLQSGGLTQATQAVAYPVLLAQRAGVTNFSFPAVANPGCPVPFTGPLTPPPPTTVPGCVRTDTATFRNRARNVAVPGARIADLLRIPPGATGQLHLLLNATETQIGAMQAASPTFVSVWIGNNDALEATTGGLLGATRTRADSSLTPVAAFQASLNQVVEGLRAANPQGVMLVGVVDAIQAAPLIQPGAFFFLARDVAGNFNGKPVNANCSPVTALGQPNPLAQNMVSFAIVGDPRFAEINCAGTGADASGNFAGEYVLDVNERALIAARVLEFNRLIKAAADANQWLYVNPNEILATFLTERDSQGRAQRIRKCQGLAGASTPTQFQTALLTTCPVPPTGATQPFAAPNLFGTLFSFDGVHPSTEAHRILAGRFAALINAKYQTTLSTSET